MTPDRQGLGPLNLQDHSKDPGQNVLYAVRQLGVDEDNRPVLEQGTLGDVVGTVVLRPDGDERNKRAAWGLALPVVGHEDPTLVIESGTQVRGGKPQSFVAAAKGPDSEGNLQECRGLEKLTYARDGSPGTVYNLKGDVRLAPGAGGVLVGSLDVDKQVPLLLDASPLIAVNQGGNPSCGTPVYDLKPSDGSIDQRRFARLQSAWRVKQLVPVNKAGFAVVDVNDKTTDELGSLCWQLTGGGPQNLGGGGLVYDDAASGDEAPAVDETRRSAETTGQTTYVDPETGLPTTQLRQQPSLDSDQRARMAGIARPVFYWQNIPVPPGKTEARLGKTVVKQNALAMVSARRGGPVDVGSEGCQHLIGMTSDGERVNAAHLRTGSIWRSPIGREGDLEFTDLPYSNPPQSLFKTRAHIRHDPKAGHDWILGTGLGKYRLEAESLWTPPIPVPDRFPPPPIGDPGGTHLPPPEVRKPPDIDSIIQWAQDHDSGVAVGQVIRNPKPAPSSNPGGILKGHPTGGLITSQGVRTPTTGNFSKPQPVAGDPTATMPGQAVAGGKAYIPGLCFLLPEQRKQDRVATGQATLVRPEAGGLLVTGAHGTEPYLVADPCKKNRSVVRSPGVALVPPCYTHDDLYNARTSPAMMTQHLPPGISQLGLGTPTRSGGVKNGAVAYGDGTGLRVVGKSSTGATQRRASLDGRYGALRVQDLDGSSPAAGDPGFVVDGDAFYGLQSDGTLVALGGGSGVQPETGWPSSGTYGYSWGPWGITSTTSAHVTAGPTSTTHNGRRCLSIDMYATFADSNFTFFSRYITAPLNMASWSTVKAYVNVNWSGLTTTVGASFSAVCQVSHGVSGSSASASHTVSSGTIETGSSGGDGSTWIELSFDPSAAGIAAGDPFYLALAADVGTAADGNGTWTVKWGEVKFDWA